MTSKSIPSVPTLELAGVLDLDTEEKVRTSGGCSDFTALDPHKCSSLGCFIKDIIGGGVIDQP